MVDREVWIEQIKDFYETELPEVVKRDIRVPKPPINRAISIIGPRRAGKTFFMFQLMKELLEENLEKERILYINLESDLLLGCELADLRNMMEIFYEIYPENKDRKTYLFLDEVQNVENWEKFVRTIMDSEDVQVYVSGSSSKLLSKEIATSMRGRTLPYHVYPFNFREFLRAKNFDVGEHLSSSEKAKLLNLLEEFMKGSYPEVILFEREREKILREIIDVTIYRDIVDRFNIRNIKVLKLLLKALISSTYFSVHKFYNYLKSLRMKVSKNTIYRYLDYFSDSLIVYPLRKYSKSYKEIEQTIPKIYLADNGLLVHNNIRSSGRLMENAVFTELMRRGYTPNKELFYFSSDRKEVDFVLVEKGAVTQLIQVCYRIDDLETRDRELSALVKAGKELGCSDMQMITWDYADIEKYEDQEIKFLPIWKWLLKS
ncbi:hypothetical protein AKJ42_02095 [candidate division MSBL1 archaeon SCGC-AAA261C02]|uniref:ATPase n=1 Tax=candidate division MSBL1 archaeon SCGC-AAA261C02 TaxID=1698272 RepID=A0A133V0I2_9EURY|nr:hypothetical protein AKJ42_02095 [candidate division MSBL1 archaeon SCGC-AAA261C02]